MIILNATKFCIATFLSNLGDVIYSVVIAWYIADVLQSGFLMGAVLFSLGLSRFIAGLLCGPVIDRIGAKLFLWLSDMIRAIIVLVLAILLWDHTISFAILIMVSVLFGVIDAFYWSASESIKPRLVATEYLSRLNSQYFTVVRTTIILGPLIAAWMVESISIEHSLIAISILYVFSTFLILFIDSKNSHLENMNDNNDKTSYFSDLGLGFSFLNRQKMIFYLVITIFFVNIGANGVNVLFPFLAKNVSDDAKYLGYIYSSMSMGSLLTGLIFSVKSIHKVELKIIYLSFLLQATGIAALCFTQNFLIILIFVFVIGLITGFIGVLIPTFVQRSVPIHLLGRVNSIMMAISMLSTPVAQFIFGVSVDYFNIKYLFFIAGALGIVTSLSSLLINERKGTPRETVM
ncbi:MFS transporter [Anoxybacillus kestanbolensis]|uniref:MFS transporter n=1 Tax=Anoxybacillus kestanbolensis TaxID=227476 RepID=UPI003D22F09F